ncbi:hypothetical protein ACN47E_004695 [Coniothyrium glycines]
MPSPPRSYTSFPSQADLFYYCTTSSTSDEDLNMRYARPSKSSLRIGVVILGQDQVQLLDLAALDLLAMLGRNRIGKLNPSRAAMDEALDEIDIRYVSVTGEGSFPVTSGSRMPVTNSFANAPQFDILIIPGSFVQSELPAAAAYFLASQFANPSLSALMCIASGISHLAQTGILHKQRAAAPRSLLATLQSEYPETFWQQSSWARHNDIWSSSSSLSALEMVTTWMREYFWDRAAAVECCMSAAGFPSMEEYNHCDY